MVEEEGQITSKVKGTAKIIINQNSMNQKMDKTERKQNKKK